MAQPDLELHEKIEVPREVAEAIKAFAAGAATDIQQQRAYGFILHGLAGVDRASFVASGDAALIMAHREGRRFVGRWLRQIVDTPFPPRDEPGAAPRRTQQTTTERVARANRRSK